MKKLSVILLIFPLLFLMGFTKKEKPYILLSSGTITQENMKYYERSFFIGQRINYAIVAPEYFKENAIRMQLSTQDDKTTNFGFSIIESRDLYIDKSQTIYRNYIVPRKKGHYILQFFYINNKRYPFAHVEFIVQ